MMPELASCPLYLGGDVGPDCTQVIHGVSGLEDSREIMNGVYMGGAAAIQQSVKSGQSNPSDYRWFLRYAGSIFPSYHACFRVCFQKWSS